MRILWKHYPLKVEDGIVRGYMTLGYQLYNLLLERKNITLEDYAPGMNTILADAVLHLTPPHRFAPVDGPFNCLFTMWEADVLPSEIVKNLQRADHVIVPSVYCQKVFENHGIKSDVVQLGVHDAYQVDNGARAVVRAPGDKLRFLFVGSTLPRKGWQLIAPAWQMAFSRSFTSLKPELYIKTIGDGKMYEAFGGSVIIDNRDMEPSDLLKLYQSADVFVFPSYGEGFGLPVLEAMATGCLAISTNAGGLSEFVHATTALVIPRNEPANVIYGVSQQMMVPTEKGLAPLLQMTLRHWGTPQMESLRLNGLATARRFTWTRTGAALATAIERATKCSTLIPARSLAN